MQLRVREQLCRISNKTTTAGAHYKGVKNLTQKEKNELIFWKYKYSSFLLIDVYAFYDLKAFSLTRMIVHRQDRKTIAHQYGSQHDA